MKNKNFSALVPAIQSQDAALKTALHQAIPPTTNTRKEIMALFAAIPEGVKTYADKNRCQVLPE